MTQKKVREERIKPTRRDDLWPARKTAQTAFCYQYLNPARHSRSKSQRYYKWRTQLEITAADSEDIDLKNQFQEIALEFPSYGYRRITAELQNRGYAVNRKRVLRLMRQDNLLCMKKKFKPVTTDSSHGLPVYPNLLKEHQDNWTESGLGFRYQIHSVAPWADLSRGGPGSLQQEMHRLGAEQKHRQPTGLECSGQGNRKSLVRVYSRTCSSFGSRSSVCFQWLCRLSQKAQNPD